VKTPPLTIAFSPCPNDTFVFHAWVHGLLTGAPELAPVRYADIDVTNGWAERGELDVLKISYGALPWVLRDYALLPTGGAVGRGCGPLVLVADERSDLRGARVAVPALRSTAYLLFRLWVTGRDPREIVVMPFSEIMPAVRDGVVDAGLVIHEARFTYPSYGLRALVDLGTWWESDTGLPIPLGAIIARRDLDTGRIATALRDSVTYAWAHPDESRDYVAAHAQELSPDVQAQHIALYVNGFTADLGDEGYAAVRALLDRAAAAELVPSVPPGLLRPY
jgi:1,4-dihydroxy-6-naphthoate synthase